MCEIKSLDFEVLSKATVLDYWKTLGKLYSKDAYTRILHNGLILHSIGEDIFLYDPISSHQIISNIEFAYFMMSGYGIIGINKEDVYLFSPKGKIKMKFVFQKSYYTAVVETREKGYTRCCSGFKLLSQFFFNYNTIATRCQNKCYLGKANKFDLKKLFYVGEYDNITEMQDNNEGFVYVLYKDGTAKLFDNHFKEVKLVDGLSKVIFLENGDFFAIAGDKCYLYDKKAKLIGEKEGVNAFYNKRFYQIGEDFFDCQNHKKCEKANIPLYKKGNDVLLFDEGNVFYNRTLKRHGFNKLAFGRVLVGLTQEPSVVNKQFLTFTGNKVQFVVDLWKSDDEIKDELIEFLKQEPADLEMEKFNYFRMFLSYLCDKDMSLRSMLMRELS